VQVEVVVPFWPVVEEVVVPFVQVVVEELFCPAPEVRGP
jgi:hypothetical protein